MVRAGQAAQGENVLNFAHAVGFHARILHSIKQRAAERLHGKVAAAAGALERACFFPHERAGNHAPDAQITREHLAGNAAHLVQLLAGENRLVAGNLEHAVGGRVDNRRALRQMLLAQFVQNRRAGRGFVADNLMPDALLKRGDKVRREAVGEGRKRLGERHARNLPVARRRILALAGFAAHAERTDGVFIRRIMRAGNLPQPHMRHVRQRRMAGIHRVTNRAGAHIAIIRRVRQFTDTAGIQYRQKNAFHFDPLLSVA